MGFQLRPTPPTTGPPGWRRPRLPLGAHQSGGLPGRRGRSLDVPPQAGLAGPGGPGALILQLEAARPLGEAPAPGSARVGPPRPPVYLVAHPIPAGKVADAPVPRTALPPSLGASEGEPRRALQDRAGFPGSSRWSPPPTGPCSAHEPGEPGAVLKSPSRLLLCFPDRFTLRREEVLGEGGRVGRCLLCPTWKNVLCWRSPQPAPFGSKEQSAWQAAGWADQTARLLLKSAAMGGGQAVPRGWPRFVGG